MFQSPVATCFTELLPTTACSCSAIGSHSLKFFFLLIIIKVDVWNQQIVGDFCASTLIWLYEVFPTRGWVAVPKTFALSNNTACSWLRNIYQGWNFMKCVIAKVASYHRSMLEFTELFRSTHIFHKCLEIQTLWLGACDLYTLSHPHTPPGATKTAMTSLWLCNPIHSKLSCVFWHLSITASIKFFSNLDSSRSLLAFILHTRLHLCSPDPVHQLSFLGLVL